MIGFTGELANCLDHVKNILCMKMDPNTAQTQSELTAELDRTVNKSMGKKYNQFIDLIYGYDIYIPDLYT